MGKMRRALLVVDVQEAYVGRKLYAKDRFLETIRGAVDRFRAAGDPIVFVRHDGAMARKGSPGWQLASGLGRLPEDPIVDKSRGDAFERTDLSAVLECLGVDRVVVCGLVSHGCVRLTCLGAGPRGLDATLLEGGHSNWARDAASRIEAVERELADAGVPTLALDRL